MTLAQYDPQEEEEIGTSQHRRWQFCTIGLPTEEAYAEVNDQESVLKAMILVEGELALTLQLNEQYL